MHNHLTPIFLTVLPCLNQTCSPSLASPPSSHYRGPSRTAIILCCLAQNDMNSMALLRSLLKVPKCKLIPCQQPQRWGCLKIIAPKLLAVLPEHNAGVWPLRFQSLRPPNERKGASAENSQRGSACGQTGITGITAASLMKVLSVQSPLGCGSGIDINLQVICADTL